MGLQRLLQEILMLGLKMAGNNLNYDSILQPAFSSAFAYSVVNAFGTFIVISLVTRWSYYYQRTVSCNPALTVLRSRTVVLCPRYAKVFDSPKCLLLDSGPYHTSDHGHQE